LLERHHDRYYGPAYLDELASEGTVHARQRKKPQRLWCCTPRGVLVSVGLHPPIAVLTAFRPDPTHEDFPGSDAAYHREARQRWKRSVVHMSVPDAWKEEVLQELEATSETPPSTTDEAWRLAWAVGHARVLALTASEVAAPLRAAEAHLERHRRQVEQLLGGKLRVEPLLSGFEAALRDDQSEEAQDRLLALEDVLVVAEVLGFAPHLQRILTELSRQVAQAPAALAGFDALARQRLKGSGQATQALWSTVLAAASRVPARALPDMLAGWLTRLDEVRGRIARGAADVLERFEVSSATLEPLVVLGRPPTAFDVHVQGRCPPTWQLRMFLVDPAHPEGERLHEGGDYTREAGGWSFKSWRLDGPEDVALLVAVAAPVLPETASLSQLLDAVASIPDTRVTEVLLRPPSEQRP
jgi:hypothetical protein